MLETLFESNSSLCILRVIITLGPASTLTYMKAMSNTRAASNPVSGNNQSGGQPASSGQQPLEVSRWSPSISSGAPTTTADSNAATWGSAASDTSRRPATVEENREQTLNILQGGAREPDDGRAAEILISRITEDPVSAGQASSSGHRAKDRRE